MPGHVFGQGGYWDGLADTLVVLAALCAVWWAVTHSGDPARDDDATIPSHVRVIGRVPRLYDGAADLGEEW